MFYHFNLLGMKLIVISKEKPFEGEHCWINRLMAECDFIFHLRKPSLTEKETEELLQRIDKRYYCRIVLHDHFPLACKYGLKGVHLNSRNPEAEIQGEYRNRCSISRSCHSLNEVVEYKQRCNYVTLSPIFDSISKTGYKSGFSYELLNDAAGKGIIDSKVVALGGIDSSNAASVIQTGFGGVAVLGTVWNHSSLGEAIAELKNLIKKIQ